MHDNQSVTRADFGLQLLLIGVAFILFYDVFDWWFTSSDVFGLIWSSRVQSLSDIGRIFSERLMADTGFPASYFRPIATLTFSLDYALWGLNPAGYLATNVLLHGLVACVLYAILRHFGIQRGVALTSSLLFLVHPLHSNTFPSIARRQDILVALFFGLSWLLLMRSQATGRMSAYIASLLALLCALWSKEIAYVLPLVHIAYLIWSIPASTSASEIRRRLLIRGTPYIIVTIVAYGYQLVILGDVNIPFVMFSPYRFNDALGWLVYAPTHYSTALRNIFYFFTLPLALFIPILFVIGHRLAWTITIDHEALHEVYPLATIRLMGLLLLWTVLPALLLSITIAQPRSMYTSLAPFSAMMTLFVAQTGRYLWAQRRAMRRDLLYWWMGLLWAGVMATIAILLLFSFMIWQVDMPIIRQASYVRRDAYDVLLKQADAIQLERADTRIINMPVLAPEMDWILYRGPGYPVQEMIWLRLNGYENNIHTYGNRGSYAVVDAIPTHICLRVETADDAQLLVFGINAQCDAP